MQEPFIIIITGFPGTGKTYLGAQLSAAFHTPVFVKDAFKEIIFDTLQASDQTWSRKVSGTAHRIMDYIIGQELQNGRNLIIESNFKREFDSQRFETIIKKYNCRCVQILCWAEGGVLADRFIARQRSAERHKGQAIDISDAQIRADLAPGKMPTLQISAPIVEVDTTDFSKVDYEAIAKQVQAKLG